MRGDPMTDMLTTRERIRREAAALFRKKGFNGTSMAELAGEVGITKSSLYHHFPSKQALLSEIIELTVNRVTPLVQEVADSDLPIRERLGRAVVLHTVEAIRDQDAIACFIEEMAAASPLGRRGQPEEIGGAVLYLCSDRATFVHGQAIAVDAALTTA